MKDVDPVEELHKIRREICKNAGGTPADYFRYYLEMDKKNAAANKPEPLQGKPRQPPAKPKEKAPARGTGKRRKAVAR